MTQKFRVTLDVHCTKKSGNRAAYRLLVANELVAERDFIWEHEEKYIQEQMVLNLDPGTYVVDLQPLTGSFIVENVTVNDRTLSGLIIEV